MRRVVYFSCEIFDRILQVYRFCKLSKRRKFDVIGMDFIGDIYLDDYLNNNRTFLSIRCSSDRFKLIENRETRVFDNFEKLVIRNLFII